MIVETKWTWALIRLGYQAIDTYSQEMVRLAKCANSAEGTPPSVCETLRPGERTQDLHMTHPPLSACIHTYILTPVLILYV